MTDWNHKRMIDKLDRMRAQRDKLVKAIEALFECADDDLPTQADLQIIIHSRASTKHELRQAKAFIELMAAIEDVKYPLTEVNAAEGERDHG